MNYYQILGLPNFATLNQIKDAYRDLVKKYHPDLNKAPHAKARFLQIQNAYEHLETQSLKNKYDEQLKSGFKPKPKRSYLRPIVELKRKIKAIRREIAVNPNFSIYDLAIRLEHVFSREFCIRMRDNSSEAEREEAVRISLEFFHVIRHINTVLALMSNVLLFADGDHELTKDLSRKRTRYKQVIEFDAADSGDFDNMSKAGQIFYIIFVLIGFALVLLQTCFG